MKVMRDIQRSGQQAGEVIQQVSDTVFPMYKAFIEPCLSRAHIRVTNSFNPFAGFKEPIQILKTEEHVSVDMVTECMRKMFPDRAITQVHSHDYLWPYDFPLVNAMQVCLHTSSITCSACNATGDWEVLTCFKRPTFHDPAHISTAYRLGQD
jgi:hypothetical protein